MTVRRVFKAAQAVSRTATGCGSTDYFPPIIFNSSIVGSETILPWSTTCQMSGAEDENNKTTRKWSLCKN
jgi:hypothetical protein